MFKFLKGVVGGSGTGLKDLPYNIGDPYPSAWGSWTHFRGTSKDDGSPVSIFSLSGSNAQDGHLAAGRNGVKRLRTVRHPNILSFLHSTEAETIDGSTSKVTIYIVTEPVMPLSEKIKELGLEGTQRDEYYAWGLHQIAKAVSFLNNDCKLVHGNVCLASVVVTPTLDWKLHAFDVLSEFDGNSEASTGQMLQFAWLIGSQYKPMELLKSDWATIRKSPAWAIDSWGLGCLIYELFSALKLGKTEELRNTASIPKSLLPDYQRLLSSTPSRRLNTSKLIENSEYFQNKLVDTIHFMEILSLKDSVEKDTFFRKLPNLAEQLPRQIVLRKLLPLLASALEFGSAAAPALTALLKMGSWLSTEEFSAKVLPTIVKLFASNDRAIRVGLLQHIDQFGESLSSQMVDEQVYPHIATGFSDTSAFLRELTLKSMLVLAPKLSQRTISGSLLKYLSKLQVDEEPAIRTNTTILLGNIASYLNEGTRKRVLINAFTVRALRDTFSPARGAGIMALCATSGYYDSTEIATRILPNLVVLTIDPDSWNESIPDYHIFFDEGIDEGCFGKNNTKEENIRELEISEEDRYKEDDIMGKEREMGNLELSLCVKKLNDQPCITASSYAKAIDTRYRYDLSSSFHFILKSLNVWYSVLLSCFPTPPLFYSNTGFEGIPFPIFQMIVKYDGESSVRIWPSWNQKPWIDHPCIHSVGKVTGEIKDSSAIENLVTSKQKVIRKVNASVRKFENKPERMTWELWRNLQETAQELDISVIPLENFQIKNTPVKDLQRSKDKKGLRELQGLFSSVSYDKEVKRMEKGTKMVSR